MVNPCLGVHERQDATRHTDISPTQDTDQHEGKKDEVGNECGEYADPGVHCVFNCTKASSPIPTGYDCT
jgi:hypothetical protein